uniref:Putative lipocalin-2 1 n=1 Tax=Amblyomma parvum TaxID=251391 RepID=A0A023G182_AMBPA
MKRFRISVYVLSTIWFVLICSGVIEKGEAKAQQKHPASKTRPLDILKVLNTTHPLWLYQQTYPNNFSIPEYTQEIFEEICIFNKKINLTGDVYHFWHKMEVNGDKLEFHFNGTINTTQNSMDVSDISPSSNDTCPFERMTLLYSDKNKCSVFAVTSLSEDATEGEECEMYIKDSKQDIKPTKGCDEFYNEKCKKGKYKAYRETCKNKQKPKKKQ